jgi:rod shape-determining protein MreD
MGDTRSGKLEERLANELLLLLGLLALALVQTALLPRPLGFPPALLLIVVVCRALLALSSSHPDQGVGAAVRWAFYGGIMLDICAATLLGTHALAMVLAVLVVVVLMARLRISSGLLPLLGVLVGMLVYELTLALAYAATVTSLDWGRHLLVIVLPSVLVALVPTLPIFALLRWRARMAE